MINSTPTKEQFEIQQLREEIQSLKTHHEYDLSEKASEIKELQNLLKLKERVETVTHAEYTQQYFPKIVLTLLKSFDPDGRFRKLYLNWMSLINYAIVCGIGVGINMYVIYALIRFLPLWGANLGAIVIAFLWNWNFSVGPLGFIFGLSPKKKKVKKT